MPEKVQSVRNDQKSVYGIRRQSEHVLEFETAVGPEKAVDVGEPERRAIVPSAIRNSTPDSRSLMPRPMSPTSDKVLCVDDDERVLRAYRRHLDTDFHIDTAISPFDALRMVDEEGPYAVVISDHLMPGMTGIDFLKRVEEVAPDSVRMMLTGCGDYDTALTAINDGRIFRFLSKPSSPATLRKALNAGLEQYRMVVEHRQYTQGLEWKVSEQTEQIRRAHEETIYRLVTASAHRDQETGAHIRRVGLFSQVLASAVGWSRGEAEQIRLAAPMHDVGKIGIPDAVLQKPGKLTDEEFRIMKTHTTVGAEMLAGSDAPVLQMASQIARSHHERWDGSGYPDGLSRESIAEEARIVAIVDVYDALTHDRVYRPALSESEAIRYLRDGRETHHDPQLLDVFLDILSEIRDISAANPDGDKTSPSLA